jgi:hypothetical protein
LAILRLISDCLVAGFQGLQLHRRFPEVKCCGIGEGLVEDTDDIFIVIAEVVEEDRIGDLASFVGDSSGLQCDGFEELFVGVEFDEF